MEIILFIAIGIFLFIFIGVICLIIRAEGNYSRSISNRREIERLQKLFKEQAAKIQYLTDIIAGPAAENNEPVPELPRQDVKEARAEQNSPLPAAEKVEAAKTGDPISAAAPVQPETQVPVTKALPAVAAVKAEKKQNESSLLKSLRSFIRGGNLWVAGGVILLFIAFVLFLTYMASRGLFSVEMRIALAVIAGLLMLVFGWRFRLRKPVYALVMQGGGIGILYLSFFAAFKLTSLLSSPAALVLISLLIPPTIILALLQNAQPLAVFGLLGGFLAPVLISDGSGSHIALFSYYLILDIAVLVISRFRHWKGLNLLAFICTFGMSLFWVIRYYTAPLFFSVEPFMFAYMLLFTFLGIRSAKHNELDVKKYIDLPLTLGTPLVGAILHWQIFSRFDHGLTIISIIFSALYLLFTFIIWKIKGPGIRRLAEVYLGISVFLGNLAIPLELSPEITGAIWAAEGALVFYYGVRFSSRKVTVTGIILHIIAALFFISGHTYTPGNAAYFRNPLFIGGLIISVSALFMAVISGKTTASTTLPEALKDKPDNTEKPNSISGKVFWERVLLCWGLLWWFIIWYAELHSVFGSSSKTEAAEVFFIVASVSALAAFGLGKLFRFPPLGFAAIGPLAFAVFRVSGILLWRIGHYLFREPLEILTFNFFTHIYVWGWLLFFAGQIFMLVFTVKELPVRIHSVWMLLIILLSVIVFTCTGRSYTQMWKLSESWTSLMGILPSWLCVAAISVTAKYLAAASEYRRRLLFVVLPGILCAATSCWFIGTLFSAGNPSPLPLYIPVLNPLELMQAFCIVIIALWQLSVRKSGVSVSFGKWTLFAIVDGMVFLWLTAMAARSCHYLFHVPFYRIPASGTFHLILLIVWGVYGIIHILAGHKKKIRGIWLAGAVLTVADIIKLLVVDLAHTGTVTRIISFFAAGLLLLFIGWAAPLPPSAKKQQLEKEQNEKNFKRLLYILFIIFAFPLFSAETAQSPENFAGQMLIDGTAGEFMFLELPENIYRHVERSDLGDIRVFDSGGVMVPFELLKSEEKTILHPPAPVPFFSWLPEQKNNLPGKTDIQVDAEGTVVRVTGSGIQSSFSAGQDNSYLIDLTGLPAPVTSLILETGTGEEQFNSFIEIQYSNDLDSWRKTDKRQTIARYKNSPSSSRNTVEIPENSKYLILKFGANTPPLKEVRAVFAPVKDAGNLRKTMVHGIKSGDSLSIQYDSDGYFPVTHIDFLLPAPDSMGIIIKNRFSEKDPWAYRREGTIYYLKADASGVEQKNKPFEISSNAPFWQISSMADIPFAVVPDMLLEWEPYRLVFFARGEGPWILAYGNSDYEPVQNSYLGPLADRDPLPSVIIGEEIYRPEKLSGHSGPDYQQIILWSVLILAVLVLSLLAYGMAKTLRKKQ
ncbi:DUF2339 domain-containing protein [Brucepastera parasyntrophica]|uniref:DUF2339 domain-containing protein n=1 Tax=Brucepastera parasyntrophica TaxID=2880008 RepID=UPI002109A8A1|nr:DUF2339 domain-containing protein [Brucepastera parasyntrophica]ULQ59529.1 DUF2339 domain-containing protein [Brucepastera parasyntrophica]